MNNSTDQIVADWLDGAEGDAEKATEDLPSESYMQVAESLLVHGLLTDLGHSREAVESEKIDSVMAAIDAGSMRFTESPSPTRSKTTRRIAFLTTAATAVAVFVMLFVFSGPQRTVNAAIVSLVELIETAGQPIDRTYEISVVDEYPRGKRPRNLPEERLRREPREQIGGATLYIRGRDKYVLVRSLVDGRKRITGCDGEQSWAFREDGPVHVSLDLDRFRGGMPGHQQDFPFINIHSHLSELKVGYDIALSDEKHRADDGTVLSQLVGVRKSRDVRGPKQVEIWFNADNGTVHQLLLVGLPRGGGGPKSVSLILIDQSSLGTEFFRHESHHEPDRRTRHEEQYQ